MCRIKVCQSNKLFHNCVNVAIMFTPSPCKTTVFKPKMSGQKPKGLSMRSNSDMNVFHSTRPTSVKGNTYSSKELKISKPKIIKQDSSEHQTYLLKVILSKVIK